MIQLAFEYFDKDDSGYITSDEFVAAMSELGDPLTEQEVGTFLKHFDVDSDGKVGSVFEIQMEDGQRTSLLCIS